MQNTNTFIGSVSKITHNAKFLLVLLRIDEGGSGRTYAVPGYRNYAQWSHLKEGDIVSGLRWHPKNKRLIDADSPIRVLSPKSKQSEGMLITA